MEDDVKKEVIDAIKIEIKEVIKRLKRHRENGYDNLYFNDVKILSELLNIKARADLK